MNTGRRNLVPGPTGPTWSAAGLMATGAPGELSRTLVDIRPELRPRSHLVNDGRNVGGDLGLGDLALPPMPTSTSSGSSTSPSTAAEDGCCG